MDDIFVDDHRLAGDASFGVVPMIEDFGTLQAAFNFKVDRSLGWDATPVGNACWKLVGFQVKIGPAEYRPIVWKDHQQPYIPKVLVLRHWPDAPGLDQSVKPRYFENADHSWTKPDEDSGAGFAYGPHSSADSDGGPDTIWVSASPPGQQPQFSDAVKNLGWYGGTNHLTANPVFQYTIKPEPEPYLAIVFRGQEFARLPFKLLQTFDEDLSSLPAPSSEAYIAIIVNGQEIGRFPFRVP